MATLRSKDRRRVENDALRRALGFPEKRDPKNKRKGTKRKRPQKGVRRISNETRQIAPTVG